MSHYSSNEPNDDGWGFYVVLDIEESFVNIISLQKKYTRTVSALPTIEEGNETMEPQKENNNSKTDKKIILTTEYTRVYFVFVIFCLYVWILLTN